MCGRSACTRGGAQIQQSVGASHFHDEGRYRPSFNVGPTRFQPVLMRDPEHGGRVLRAMRWGLVPFWTKKEPDFGSIMKAINARDDSLTSNKPMFNHIKKARRCVVIADGFFEWLKDSTPRQPYFVQFQGGNILTMAGLYDIWKNAEGEELYTYTIITTEPNSALSFLHDRMPLLLDSEEEIDRWLNPEVPFEEVKALMRPYQGKLDIFPVSTFVNKIGNDSEECCKPITKKLEAQKITSFFRKNEPKKPAQEGNSKEQEKEKEKEKEEKKTAQAEEEKQKEGEEKEEAASKKRAAPEEEEKVPPAKKVKVEESDHQEEPQEEPKKEEDPELQSKMNSIVEMGFTEGEAKEALEKFGGDLAEACDWLINSEAD